MGWIVIKGILLLKNIVPFIVAIVINIHMSIKKATETKFAFSCSKNMSILSRNTLPLFFAPTKTNSASNLNKPKITFESIRQLKQRYTLHLKWAYRCRLKGLRFTSLVRDGTARSRFCGTGTVLSRISLCRSVSLSFYVLTTNRRRTVLDSSVALFWPASRSALKSIFLNDRGFSSHLMSDGILACFETTRSNWSVGL